MASPWFGIKTSGRAVTFTQHGNEIGESRFQLAIGVWGAGNPHPHFSFTGPLFYNNLQAANQVGMGFPMKARTRSGDVDFEQLITDSASGLDEYQQKGVVTRLALAYNELLPYITLWERYGSSPALEDVRVTGWAPESDPIWKNNHSGDNPVIMMILEGRLKGK